MSWWGWARWVFPVSTTNTISCNIHHFKYLTGGLTQNLPSITSVLWSDELMFRFSALFFIALGEKSAGCVCGGLWDKFSSLLLLLPIMCSALALLCSLISGSEDILLKYHFMYQRRNRRKTQTFQIVLSDIGWPPSSTIGWRWHHEVGRWVRWTKRPRRVCPCSYRGGWGLAVLKALSAAVVVEIWSDFVLEPTKKIQFLSTQFWGKFGVLYLFSAISVLLR